MNKGEKNMIVGVVVGSVVVSAAVGYGVVRIAVSCLSLFDTYANEDDSELDEDEDDEDEG